MTGKLLTSPKLTIEKMNYLFPLMIVKISKMNFTLQKISIK